MKFYNTDADYLEHLQQLLGDSLPELYNVGVSEANQRANTDLRLSESISEGVWRNSTVFANVGNKLPQPIRTQWSGSDNPDAYAAHFNDPESRKLLDRWGWTDQNVVYEINSDGWRSRDCREFDIDEPSLIVLGCSFTFGTGLNLEQTWGAKLAQRMGLELVNLGVPGHSLDLSTAWLMLNQHRITNPRAVVICETPPARISWLAAVKHARTDTFTYPLFTLATGHDRYSPSQIHAHNWLIDNIKINSAVSYFKNRKLVEYWANSKNIPLVHFNALGVDYQRRARDLAHFGDDWHDAVADGVATCLTKNS